MRIYVPATLDELEGAVVAAGGARWDVPARRAHAVTPAMVRELPDDDDETREYEAFLAAADDSLALVAARRDVPPLRAVVSVDVPDTSVTAAVGAEEASAVDVAALSGVAVVAVHVDEPEAADDVRAVLAAADEENDAERAGDVGATSEEALDAALQRVTDRDLLWYDPTEISQIPRP
ncbi:hypothetical protein M1843_15015 [Isoptericola sp. 4D.3]|jgi:hypothetical protein|uniref:Uncharacterized protein n=1 Tax=Isoptericola peretonis TaxID=2918523 RepID=A0ABT0J6D6_9MICO|nr:hypothetical protein [Isoptericola sp. 4D.3]